MSSSISLTIVLFVFQVSIKQLYGNVLPGEVKFVEVLIEESENPVNENFTLDISPRQEYVERPFENVPRVVNSVQKIVKGILTGNIHDIFHGSFSFAPRETANQLIAVYNQVAGLPDPTQPTEPTLPTVAGSLQIDLNSTDSSNSTANVKPGITEIRSPIVPLTEEDPDEEETI